MPIQRSCSALKKSATSANQRDSWQRLCFVGMEIHLNAAGRQRHQIVKKRPDDAAQKTHDGNTQRYADRQLYRCQRFPYHPWVVQANGCAELSLQQKPEDQRHSKNQGRQGMNQCGGGGNRQHSDTFEAAHFFSSLPCHYKVPQRVVEIVPRVAITKMVVIVKPASPGTLTSMEVQGRQGRPHVGRWKITVTA